MPRLLRLLPAAALVALAAPPAAAQTPPGRLDPTFSTDGVAFGTVADSEARDVIVDADGLVTIAGTFEQACGTGTAGFVARYTADGEPLASFGQNGVVRFADDCNADTEADRIVALPDGSFLLVGESDVLGEEVQRVLPTGAATCRTSLGFGVLTGGAAATPEGDVVVATTRLGGGGPSGVTKIDVHYGTGACPVATEFGTDGTADFALLGLGSVEMGDVAVQPDGRIVATGGNAAGAFVARLTPAGARDPFFGPNGVGFTVGSGEARFATSVATGPTGDIVVAGSEQVAGSQDQWYVQRFRFDGIPDVAFSDDSVVLFPPGSGLSGGVTGLTIDDDNQVVLVGRAVAVTPAGATRSWAIARLSPDGRFDAPFGQDGITVERPFGLQGELAAVTFQPGGNPIVAGYVSLPTGGDVWAVARYEGKAPVAAEAAPLAAGTRLTIAPNPAVSRATVTVEQHEAGSLRVSLVDALGREVAVVHDGALAAGTHRLALPLGALAPGVYAVRAAGVAPARVVVAR